MDSNDPEDGNLYTLDTEKGWYTNVEVYLNAIVENKVKAQNADALTAVEEYYPASTPAFTGIEDTAVKSEVVKIEYYTLDGMKVDEPVEGISIRRVVYADGRTATEKIIK